MNALFKISGLSILFLIGGLIYFPFLGEINLFDWDETLIASVSREMFERNEVLQPWLNGKYFLEAPPLFFWTQLLSFKYLGINEYAARFPNAVCALLVILTLYKNGQRLYSTSFGMMWAVIYMSMLLPQFYHKSGLLEPWFCFFIYLSLYNLTRVIEARQEQAEGFYKRRDIFSNLFYSAFAVTGAVMTKGIEAYIVVVLTYWLVFILSSAKYGFGYASIFKWTSYLVLFIMIWIGIEYKWHGLDYLKQFLNYQWAELDIKKATWTNRISFQFLILFLGCFPASALAFNSIQLKSYESTIQKVFRLTMFCTLIIVLIISSLFKTKLAHYSVLAYFPISYMAAYSLRYIFEEKQPIKKATYFLIVLGGIIWTTCLTLVPLTRANLDFFNKYIHEDTLQYALAMNYPWSNIEILIGVIFFALFIMSIILLIRKKNRAGLILLFFSCMITAEIILVYYVPKIEQMTQGAQVDFINQNKNEQAYYYYYGGRSYISNFYSTYPVLEEENFSLDSIQNTDLKKYPYYLIAKKTDTSQLKPYHKHLQYLYQQGIYSFYKLKK